MRMTKPRRLMRARLDLDIRNPVWAGRLSGFEFRVLYSAPIVYAARWNVSSRAILALSRANRLLALNGSAK
jgi:hypothetical protein